MRIRCFIAFDVPDDVSAQLFSIQKKLSGFSLNFTRSFHLTLKFLGDIDNQEAIINQLKTFSFSSFEIGLDEIGTFPDIKHPRVIWAGIDDPEHLILFHSRLQKSLDGLASRDDHPYHPHITIARARNTDPKMIEAIKSLNLDKTRFTAGSFHLYQSTLTSMGPIYNKIYSFFSC